MVILDLNPQGFSEGESLLHAKAENLIIHGIYAILNLDNDKIYIGSAKKF